MRSRSLTHFAHRPIGKTTHDKGYTYKHVDYIMRDDACTKVIGENMPLDRNGARPYFEREANKEGVPDNARIADRLVIALPIEMTAEQRHEAVASFMEKIGKHRIAWMAAFHDKGKDEHNPHCHLIFRDADIETGRKVVGTTTSAKDVREAEERGWKVPPRMTTKDLRYAWCDHINAEMERHGYDARFDARTLKRQGIHREPQIHVGPSASDMAKRNHRFENGRGDHTNPYTLLDAGSRAEHNRRIIEQNKKADANRQHIDDAWKRKLESVQPKNDEQRAKLDLQKRQGNERRSVYAEQKKDRDALREAHQAQKLEHAQWARVLYATARKQAFTVVKQANDQRWKEARRTKDKETRQTVMAELKEQQKIDYRNTAEVEIERVRPIKNEAWQKLKAEQEKERAQIAERQKEEVSALTRQHIAERHALQEHWLQQNMATATAKMNARAEAGQSMPMVQADAVRLIKIRVRAAKERDRFGQVPEPGVAVTQHFTERARAEEANRSSIRYNLNTLRQNNAFRAAGSAKQRTQAGVMAERRSAIRVAIVAQRTAREASDQQKTIAAAVQSGRSLSSAERANASPGTKARVSSREAKEARKQRQFDLFVKRENANKGRDGGGRSGR